MRNSLTWKTKCPTDKIGTVTYADTRVVSKTYYSRDSRFLR